MPPISNQDLDTFASITERDVDLILVLALHANEAVRKHVAGLARCDDSRLVSVRHSSTCADGREVDVEARFGDPARPHVIQIENKLLSGFQENQAAAYRDRADTTTDQVVRTAAILFAPERYIASARADVAMFSGTLSYESLRDMLASDGNWGHVASCILEHAIRQHRRGSNISPDSPHRTQFFQDFARLAEAKGLPPVPPRGRKSGAGFLWYPRAKTLTQLRGWRFSNASHGAWLVAKFEPGYVDIELTGIRRLVDQDSLMRALVETPVKAIPHNSGVQVRTETASIDPDLPIQQQSLAVAKFVDRLVELRTWWENQGRHIVEASLRSEHSADRRE